MSGEPFQVTFQDSSDDERNEQVAEVIPVTEGVSGSTPLPTPTGRSQQIQQLQQQQQQQQQQKKPSWFRRAVNGASNFLFSAIGGQYGSSSNEPFHVAQIPVSVSSVGDQWDYAANQDSAALPSDSRYADSVDPSEEIAVDLREVILQYRRTPDDVYMRIILAALYFGEVQINGDVFSAAVGDRELIKTLLLSGKVNVDDPEVQQVIQDEIDSVMVTDAAHGAHIYPDKIEYLALLCRVPSATITREQARLCRHAGFEFTKMLLENPHVLRNLPPPRWIVARILDVCYVLNMVLTWFGLIGILLNLACVTWLTYNWLVSDYPSCGYWTILCYVVGYVVSIVVLMISEEGRIRDYDERIWDYPDNTLKIIPCIPLFEIALMYVTLRYEFIRDKGKYIVIRYDLYNGLSNVLIIHTYFFATLQLVVQHYLGQFCTVSSSEFISYKVLNYIDYILYGMSLYLFLRKVFFNFSCNSFGFAVMAVKQAFVMPIDITTRILIVMLAFYLECNIIACGVSLWSIAGCSFRTVIFICVITAVTVLVIISLALALVFSALRQIWLIALPAILVQIAFSIYVVMVRDKYDDDPTCMVFSLTASFPPPFTYVTFAFLCISFIACLAVSLYAKLTTGKQLFPSWDNYYHWTLGR